MAKISGDDRERDGWMASPTQWTWVWVNSGSWWWTRRPGVLWFIGSQRVGHNLETELNWLKRQPREHFHPLWTMWGCKGKLKVCNLEKRPHLFMLASKPWISSLQKWKIHVCSYKLPVTLAGFPWWLGAKEHTCQCRRCKRSGFHPWVGKIPWEGDDNWLQYSCLENPLDRGAWQDTVHQVAIVGNLLTTQ